MQHAPGDAAHDFGLGGGKSGLGGRLVVTGDRGLDAFDEGADAAAARPVDLCAALVAANPLFRRRCVGHELVPCSKMFGVARVLMPPRRDVKAG